MPPQSLKRRPLRTVATVYGTYGRSWAELVGPEGSTTMRFHHPCGHTSTKDFSKGRVAKRMGPEACRMMAKRWTKERGGVLAPCPTCVRKARAGGR